MFQPQYKKLKSKLFENCNIIIYIIITALYINLYIIIRSLYINHYIIQEYNV